MPAYGNCFYGIDNFVIKAQEFTTTASECLWILLTKSDTPLRMSHDSCASAPIVESRGQIVFFSESAVS